MKKFDLIHTTVLIIAILTGYSALQYCLSAISTFAYAYSASKYFTNHNPLEPIIGYLVVAVIAPTGATAAPATGRVEDNSANEILVWTACYQVYQLTDAQLQEWHDRGVRQT